jgi:transcriptional regulator with XRE-family HTH domain
MDLRQLGKQIQDLRAERGLTLHHLAEASAVSVSMLSAVERGQKAATVTVLDRIASGLGLSLAALVGLAADSRVIVRRAAEQDVIDEPGGWQRTILTPVVPGVNFEWIRTTLPAVRRRLVSRVRARLARVRRRAQRHPAARARRPGD